MGDVGHMVRGAQMTHTEENDVPPDSSRSGLVARVGRIISVDSEDVLQAAREAGLAVNSVEDFRSQVPNYWRIEDLTTNYGKRAVRYRGVGSARTFARVKPLVGGRGEGRMLEATTPAGMMTP